MRYIVLGLALLFSACSLKSEFVQDGVTNNFLISIPDVKKEDKKYHEAIKIPLPVGANFLYTNKITYTLGDGEYGSYLYNFWLQIPAKQLQFLLANTLTQSELFSHVVVSPSKIDNRLLLESRVERFEYYLKNDISKVRLHVNLFLVDENTRKVLKSKRFVIDKNVAEKNPQGIVKGFSRAFEELSSRMILWLKN